MIKISLKIFSYRETVSSRNSVCSYTFASYYKFRNPWRSHFLPEMYLVNFDTKEIVYLDQQQAKASCSFFSSWKSLDHTQNWTATMILKQFMRPCFSITFLSSCTSLSFWIYLTHLFHYGRTSFSCGRDFSIHVALLSSKWCFLSVGVVQETLRLLLWWKKSNLCQCLRCI